MIDQKVQDELREFLVSRNIGLRPQINLDEDGLSFGEKALVYALIQKNKLKVVIEIFNNSTTRE